MPKLRPDELRAVWAAYMEDASARREPIPLLKLELLDEIANLDIKLDKGDPATIAALKTEEVAKIADRITKVRSGWTPLPPIHYPDAGDPVDG